MSVKKQRSRPKPKEKREPSELAKRLIKWRKENKLSQRQAAKAMNDAEVPINSTTLQQWEYGRHAPSPLAGKIVTKFLDEHPQITGVPEYRNKTKLTAENLVEIRRRSKNGEKLREIADSFGLSESYISRILKGERRPRVSV
jgi:transcriptional regulator with XRE-family HTH domain